MDRQTDGPKKKTKLKYGEDATSLDTTQKHSWNEIVSWVFPGYVSQMWVRRVDGGVGAREHRVSSEVRGEGLGL